MTTGRCARLVVAALLFIVVPSMMGQTASTGALTGTVTDTTGAVVPNATVTVTSADSGQVRTAMTDSSGSYKFSLLSPGNYQVKFEASGFNAIEIPSATVAVTETGVLNGQLEVGTQNQQVTVEANVETVQTASSALGTVVNSQTVTDLPLSTRNYTNLLALSAGANAAVNNATLLGKGFQNSSVNGAASTQNNYQMDGASIVNWSGSGSLTETGSYAGIAIPTPDAIQEFKIQTSTFDAGYGRNAGANVNVVSKSGTNDFHGTAFEFFRNTVLNANDFFNEYSQLSQGKANSAPVLNQNQFGGVVGGPVKKDKLFFFLAYQQTYQKNGLSPYGFSTGISLPPIPGGNRGTCPPGATALAQCDSVTQSIFVPALGAAISPLCPGSPAASNSSNIASSLAGVTTGNFMTQHATQLACNGSNINPTALQILQLKLPNGSYYIPGSGSPNTVTAGNIKQGYLTNVTASDPAIYHEYQGTGNWDYVINSKNTLSGRYFYSIDPFEGAFVCGISGTACLDGAPVTGADGSHAAVLKLTSILSSNLVNEARVSAQRYTILDTNGIPFTDTQVGITPAVPTTNNLTNMMIANTFNIGAHAFSQQHDVTDATEVGDQLSWTHGKHTLRFGFESEHQHYSWIYPSYSIGLANFDSFGDFLLGLPGCSPALTTAQCTASGLAGTSNGTTFSNIDNISSGQRTADNLLVHYVSNALDGFVQDDFKLNPRLTLNMGLRWEYDGLIWEQNGDTVDIWLSQIKSVPIPPSAACATASAATPQCAGAFAGFVVASNYKVGGLNPPIPAGVLQNVRKTPAGPTPLNNFAPRLGFAWQPLHTDRFVVRGGAGYFYDRVPNLSTNIHQDPPLSVGLTASGASNFASTLQQPFLTTPVGWQPRWANFASGTSSSIALTGFDQRFLTPLVYQYSLGIQEEFLRGWVLDFGYVGSSGIHQWLAVPVNGAPLATVATPINCGYDGNTADCLTSNTTTGGTSSGQAGALIRAPYLGYANNKTETETVGNYKFNSLQATVRKQLSHGVTLQTAYTWSRAFITTYYGNPNAAVGQNPVVGIYALNPNYRPQRLVVNYSWDLPFGHPEGLRGKLVTGWNIAGVTVIQDGTPMTLTDSRFGNIFGTPILSSAQYAPGMTSSDVKNSGSLLSKVVSGLGSNSSLASSGYFNKNAFVGTSTVPLPAVPGGIYGNGRPYGNSGLSTVLGPGQNNWDLTLRKITTVGGLHEGATLEFRTEFFNTFNHPQFNNPVLTVNTSALGQINGSSVNPRLIQFALKYAF